MSIRFSKAYGVSFSAAYLLLTGTLFMQPAASAQSVQGSWQPIASTQSARGSGVSAVSGGRVYIIGGGPMPASGEVFDPQTNSWSNIAPIPTPRSFAAGVAGPDGRIYVIGGTSNGNTSATVEVYNPANNSWAAVAPLPAARFLLAAATGLNGNIYAFGGVGTAPLAGDVYSYNPSTDTWTTVAPLPTPRSGLAAATGNDGTIYAIGGGDSNSLYSNVVEQYNPTSNTWSTTASLPTARRNLGAAKSSGGIIFAVGGFIAGGGSGGTAVDTVETFDPATSTWTTAPSLTQARGLPGVASTSDGKVYAIGGRSGPNELASAEVFAPIMSSTTLRLYLRGNDVPKINGNFVMNDTVTPGNLVSAGLLSSVSWLSDPALSGAFPVSATYTVSVPCSIGVGVLTQFQLAQTQSDGSGAQPLGTYNALLGACVGNRTIAIPVRTAVTLNNQRLRLTIRALLGLNLNVQLGSGTFFEATQFSGTP